MFAPSSELDRQRRLADDAAAELKRARTDLSAAQKQATQRERALVADWEVRCAAAERGRADAETDARRATDEANARFEALEKNLATQVWLEYERFNKFSADTVKFSTEFNLSCLSAFTH